ncbi:MAG: hypothetical protein NTX59_07605 [Elusimicrobia bacterium]|nr:hypothetical protein [Elusimicrobiota bacterium]
MTAGDNDPLVYHLAELARELDTENIPIILGGGMCLYLRQKFLSVRNPRYPFDLPARSTADLDIFLSSRLIIDAGKIESLRRVIGHLGYNVLPEAKNFQFAKKIMLYGQERTIKIDLLAAPPRDEDLSLVSVHGLRIKPKGAAGIHAYLTDESEGIEFGKLFIDPGRLEPSLTLKNKILFIPSAFNFLILKFHAFNDRKNDEARDLGRYHAWDIFATVVRMSEVDWTDAKEHLAARAARPYINKAAEIRKTDFSARTALGLLRLRENEAYKRERDLYDKYLEPFIEDLAALLPDL